MTECAAPSLFLAFAGHIGGGHVLIGNAGLRAGGYAGHAADAVRVTHEIRVGHIDVHRAGLGAEIAVNAALRIAAYADDSQNAQQTTLGATGAGVVAERTVEEHTNHHRNDEYNQRGRGYFLALHQRAEAARAVQRGNGESQRADEVQNVPAQLQVSLYTLRHAQLRQVQQTPQLIGQILYRAQRTYPTTGQDAQQKNTVRQPPGNVFAAAQSIDKSCHQCKLYEKSNRLYPFAFVAHVLHNS